jgi:hypothetical protein
MREALTRSNLKDQGSSDGIDDLNGGLEVKTIRSRPYRKEREVSMLSSVIIGVHHQAYLENIL